MPFQQAWVTGTTADKFVTNGWWTAQPSSTALTLNGFIRNAKHGFNSCKWSNVPWNFSSSFGISVCILPLCGPQLPVHAKQSFSFWHGKMTECFWQYVSVKKFQFYSGNLSSFTWTLGSMSFVVKSCRLSGNKPIRLRTCVNTLIYETNKILAVHHHSV